MIWSISETMTRILTAVLVLVVLAGSVPATALVTPVPRMVSYQGYLEASGAPYTGTAQFKFVILCGTTVTAWSNDDSSVGASEPSSSVPVDVAAGAFSVMLGDSSQSMNPIDPDGFTGCTSVNLRIWVDSGSGFEQLPDQPVVSTVFALEADSAWRSNGSFLVDQGSLVLSDDADVQVFSVLNSSIGPGFFEGPSIRLTNSAGTAAFWVNANEGGSGSSMVRLYDNAGTENVSLDGATGEIAVQSIRFGDESVQTTAGGASADSDWVVAGSDMYSAVSGNVGIGTGDPGTKLTVSRSLQAEDHQIEVRNEGSIQSPNFDGIKFTQGADGSTILGEMRLDYRNNGRPDLGFHLRDQPNILYMKAATGNVGIGTTSPGSALHVKSEITTAGQFEITNPSSPSPIIETVGSHSGPHARFNGDVEVFGTLDVTGTLTKGSGTFRIDHPLEPEAKYLSHSFVESPDMMNIYNGNVNCDKAGKATIVMPDWFSALNVDFRYQLTCIGGFAPVYVEQEIEGNGFTIAGGTPGLKVSWQVTGVRNDAYARANPVQVEEDKPADLVGYYLHPEAFGLSAARGIIAAAHLNDGVVARNGSSATP